MDKASRALRRSGVKLLSMSSGHADLNVLVSDIKEIKNTAKAFMTAQHLASQDMSRWAAREENRVVQDVVSNIADLLHLWSEVQKNFIGHLKEYRQMFEMILEGEKHVSQAKDNLEYCQEKEMKVRKEMRKVAKRASAVELRILQSRVEMAEKAREVAEAEVSDRVRENEAVKLIRLKEGILKISGAYIEMANQCNTVFMAERDVALQLPDVHGQHLETIRYSGAGTTRFIVEKTKEVVQSYTYSDVSKDPPPPYTPPEDTFRNPRNRNPNDSSNISQGSSGQSINESSHYDTPPVRPNAAPHRHSVPYDIRSGSGNNNGCPRQRSRSDNNVCGLNQQEVRTEIPTSQSNHSLPSYGFACSTSVSRETSHNSLSRSVSDSNPVTSSSSQREDLSQNTIPPSTETFVHANDVQIRQVVELPPVCATGKSNGSLGPDGNSDYTEPKRTATEQSFNEARIGDDIRFADDDDNRSTMPQTESVRPVPSPRGVSSRTDVGEGYTTAEEGQ